MNQSPIATGVTVALQGSSPLAVGNEVDWFSWGPPAFLGVPGGPELLVLLLLIVIILVFRAVSDTDAGLLRRNEGGRTEGDAVDSEPDPDEGHGDERDGGDTATGSESDEGEGATRSLAWSGLVIDEVRSQSDRTDVVIRNVVDEHWDPSNAEIEDPYGNRHSLPASLSIAPGGSEIIRFDRGEGEAFRAAEGEEVVLHTEDGERTVLWEEPEE